LSLIQTQMSIALKGNQSDLRRSAEITNLVQAAISMCKENGGKVTPQVQKFLGGVLKQIDGLIPHIMRAHNTNKADLARLRQKVVDANTDLDKKKKISQNLKIRVGGYRTTLSTCRKAESAIYVRHQACLQKQASLYQIMKSKETAAFLTLNVFKSMFGSNPSKARMLSRKFRDGVQATATKYIPQDKALNFAIDAWKKQVAKCNGIAKELASKKKSCNGNQAVFEQYSCSYYLGVVSNCKNSKTAYTKAANAFAAEKASVKILEKDRKAEFTGLMKAHCILKAISGSKGQLSMAKLDKCKSVGISTAKLNLQYLAPPAKLSCTPTPLYPCQSQFLKAEYSGMPKGTTPAKCTPCAGAKPPVPAQCKTASAIPNKGTRLITTPYKGLCDNRLKSGWYKYPGHKMPEKSPGKMKCGTHAPGYLTSSHPSSKGATKSIKVCYHWGRPCQWSQNILVTSCGGGQFVYKLAKTPFCSGSFCFKPTR